MAQFRLYLPSGRRQWLSIFPTNFSRYPLMLPRFGMSSSGSVIAVKIYRGKLKCHGIIARSETIKIPDSKLQTIEPRDRTRPDYCVPFCAPRPKVRGLTKLQPTLSITIFRQTFNFEPSVPIDRFDNLILHHLACFTNDITIIYILSYIYIYIFFKV